MPVAAVCVAAACVAAACVAAVCVAASESGNDRALRLRKVPRSPGAAYLPLQKT
jgi:hypothetical protein